MTIVPTCKLSNEINETGSASDVRPSLHAQRTDNFPCRYRS